MADRLGGTELDSGSRSTKSSRPDWETILTHNPMGRAGPGRTKTWKRDLIGKGAGAKPRESRSMKRRLQARANPSRMGNRDEEVLMVVESQAARLSELDSRNRSIVSENSEIKSVLLKSNQDMGAMRSQMEQMAELLKLMATQGALRSWPPDSVGENTKVRVGQWWPRRCDS